jgi:hypothetical protein
MMVELLGQRMNEGTDGGYELRYGGGAVESVIGWRMWILAYPIQDADNVLAEILMDGDVVVPRLEPMLSCCILGRGY